MFQPSRAVRLGNRRNAAFLVLAAWLTDPQILYGATLRNSSEFLRPKHFVSV